MTPDLIVIDNFLDKPDLVRQSALSLEFSSPGPYPGLRSDRADYDYENYVKEKIEKIAKLKIKEFIMDSFRFQICLEGEKTFVHIDKSGWAGVLYLTPNAPYESGTGFWRNINNPENDRDIKPDDGNEHWIVESAVGFVYNRLILYKATIPHSSILPGFGNSIETGRLTQVFFFEVEDE
jgi:hypothetical protein